MSVTIHIIMFASSKKKKTKKFKPKWYTFGKWKLRYVSTNLFSLSQEWLKSCPAIA